MEYKGFQQGPSYEFRTDFDPFGQNFRLNFCIIAALSPITPRMLFFKVSMDCGLYT